MRLAHTGPAWKTDQIDKRSGKESKEGEKGELYVGSKMRGNFDVRIHFPAKGGHTNNSQLRCLCLRTVFRTTLDKSNIVYMWL